MNLRVLKVRRKRGVELSPVCRRNRCVDLRLRDLRVRSSWGRGLRRLSGLRRLGLRRLRRRGNVEVVRPAVRVGRLRRRGQGGDVPVGVAPSEWLSGRGRRRRRRLNGSGRQRRVDARTSRVVRRLLERKAAPEAGVETSLARIFVGLVLLVDGTGAFNDEVACDEPGCELASRTSGSRVESHTSYPKRRTCLPTQR